MNIVADIGNSQIKIAIERKNGISKLKTFRSDDFINIKKYLKSSSFSGSSCNYNSLEGIVSRSGKLFIRSSIGLFSTGIHSIPLSFRNCLATFKSPAFASPLFIRSSICGHHNR